jgi:phosphatidylinositol alpha-1,6-mannosyltransferase
MELGRSGRILKPPAGSGRRRRYQHLLNLKSLLLAPELFSSEGGITRILRLYLKAMCEIASEGDSVQFVSLNDRVIDDTDIRKYSNARLKGWQICDRRKITFVLAALRIGRRSDSIVCGHVAQLPVAWAVSFLRPTVKYYLVAHGIEVWRPFTFFERRALNGAEKIFCVSKYTRDRLVENCPLPEGRTAILPNALDPYLNPSSVAAPDDQRPVVLTISRLSATENYKGVAHLIAAMPAVCAALPGAQLRIVGRGDAMRGLQDLALSLNMAENIRFLGFQTDEEVKGEFQRCRMFALPSKKEGFGLVYIEAMAHGRPCVAASSGGVPEVVTPETGILVEFGDVPKIAAAILACLSKKWDIQALRDRADSFSYVRLKDRLASYLCA